MRFSKLMGLAIVLVALAVAINALAFKSAEVTNAATFTVSATDSAALAIKAATTPGTGFTASNLGTGFLTLAITDNMQPNSKYKFSGVFKISNTTASNITGVGYTTTFPAAVGTITLLDASDSTPLSNETLATPGGAIDVDMEITLLSTATTGAKTFNIVITGNQAP